MLMDLWTRKYEAVTKAGRPGGQTTRDIVLMEQPLQDADCILKKIHAKIEELGRKIRNTRILSMMNRQLIEVMITL